MADNLVKRFAALFRGNERSFGQWFPDTAKMMTEKKAVSEPDYLKHISGEVGLGMVPIMDAGTCWFGAIDIDNHGQSDDIDLAAITKRIEEKQLPLVACRSKSGGVHAYAFGSEPLKAKAFRAVLSRWAGILGYPDAEIFPKQDGLQADLDGTRPLGNWINLCYFNGDDTNRYAVKANGKKMPLEPFIELAESKRISQFELSEATQTGHHDAPPCIQSLLNDGVPDGYRNQALYNIAIYLKRAKPNTYIDDAIDINSTIFSPPLPSSEARRTIRSATRREYHYKCGEEPCKSRCNSKECVKREFGITPSEFDDINAVTIMPELGDVIKYNTDPCKWGMYVNGMLIDQMSTQDLLDFSGFKHKVFEKFGIIIPQMTRRKWEALLAPKTLTARVVDVPRDASAQGVIAARLLEFLDKAQTTNITDEMKEREKLTRGIPCVQTRDGVKYVMFRAMDFVKYLKTTKSEELRGPNLWFALKNELGVEHMTLRVKEKVINVWYAPLDKNNKVKIEMPDFKQEF